MLKVFQVGVYRVVWRGANFPACHVRVAGSAGSGAAIARALIPLHYSTHRRTLRSCTVDPNLEEQFVYVACTDPEEELLSSSSSAALSDPPPGLCPGPPAAHLRSLERQQRVLRGVSQQEAEPNSLIHFYDVDFPLDGAILAAKNKIKKTMRKGEHRLFGTPDVDEPFSDTCCSGCGAMLHCTAANLRGYLPSEKYKTLLQEGRLNEATCQRCHLLTHHHKALNLNMTADQYQAVVQQLRPLKALVLLIVDLMDVPDSIVPNLPQLVGTNKHIVVLGNKIDLLPPDSPNYQQRIKRQLSQYCHHAAFGTQVTDIHLISAKTGYGIESLVSSLQRSWKYKGDVYLVGSANAGKSTLFNALLESDYCKSRASALVNKATISPWPGTTVNLLKFPIINPTPYRMFQRQKRLHGASKQTEAELKPDELKRLRHLSRRGYLVGRVGRTFLSDITSRRDEIDFDPDSLAFGENEETMTVARSMPSDQLTFNELKDARWLFDTPGIMKEHDILNLLTEEEVISVVPTQAIVPRTFVLKPSMSLFVGGIARIDFLQGGQSCWFSVMASSRVPVHVTSLEKADSVYEKHVGHILLGVPLGGRERMEQFPPLVPQDLKLKGQGYLEAIADIKLSSAGWVAVTAAPGDQLVLRLHGPQTAAFSIRVPPLLPHIVSLKGERVRKSAAYITVKPRGRLDSGLSAVGAEKLQVKKKK